MNSIDIILGERWRTDPDVLDRLRAGGASAAAVAPAVHDVVEIVVDGLTVTAQVPADNVFQIVSDLVSGMIGLLDGTRSKCLVQFHEGPWELCVARPAAGGAPGAAGRVGARGAPGEGNSGRGSGGAAAAGGVSVGDDAGPGSAAASRAGDVLLSFYGTVPPRGVVIKDRPVALAALCEATSRAAERLARALTRVNGDLGRGEPVVALGRAARRLRKLGGRPPTAREEADAALRHGTPPPDGAPRRASGPAAAAPGVAAASSRGSASHPRVHDVRRAAPVAAGGAVTRSDPDADPDAARARARGGRRHSGWWRPHPTDSRLRLAWWFDAHDEFLTTYHGENRYDLHALLARGGLGLRGGTEGAHSGGVRAALAGGPAGRLARDFAPGFPVLDVEAWVAAAQQLVLAAETGERDVRVEIGPGAAVASLAHGGRVALAFDEDRGDEPAVLCALEELVAAVVESGRALCEALLEVNPRLRANLRLADLRDEVDELAGWHGDLLQREVVNDAPERYRVEHVAGWSPAAPGAAAASAGAGARTLASGTTAGADGAGAAARATTPAGPDSDAAANAGPAVAPPRALTGASRVRFSEKWRLEADGVELCATLPGDRLLCRLDGRLLCLDADSGRTHWRLGAAASSGAALTEDGGLLVATGGGHLAAYGTADGSKLWEIPGQGADEPRGAGRPLRVALGGRALLVLGTGDQRVLCLDAATGARVWEFAARRGGGFHFAALERLLFVATANGSVCALDLSDGRLVWRFKARARLEHAPVVWHDQVMVCSGRSPVDDGRVFALDAFSGELRWQRRVGTAVECAPLLHGGRLFVSAEHAGGARLVAIRAADGVVLWRRELESAGVAPVGTAVACAGLVVVKSDAGGVHALDPATGERRWMVSLAGGVVPDVLRNAPLRSWGEALFAGYDAAYLLDPADGRVLLRIDDQGGIPDDLAVDAAGRVFVCEEGDHLAAHKLTTVLRVVR